eukprot:s5689_g4.t1
MVLLVLVVLAFYAALATPNATRPHGYNVFSGKEDICGPCYFHVKLRETCFAIGKPVRNFSNVDVPKVCAKGTPMQHLVFGNCGAKVSHLPMGPMATAVVAMSHSSLPNFSV